MPEIDRTGAVLLRAIFCLLLCVVSAHAVAGTLGISGGWFFYGNRDGKVHIDEESGILEDGTSGTSYVLLEEQGADWRRVARKGAPGDVRKIRRVNENVLLFLGVKNPILVREGARFTPPREKIRGRWHYATQMNEAFYYDAEFDLDTRKVVDISRSESGGHIRGEARPLEMLLDAQVELALRTDGTVYHFMRLGADFLVLEPSYGTSVRNGYKILMARTQALKQTKTETTRQADTQSRTTKAAKTKTKNGKSTKSRKAKQAEPGRLTD